LSADYVGSVSDPEQALYLAPATDFSETFGVGDILEIATNVASSQESEDLGLAIAANDPVVASSGNSWNSRNDFDYLEFSLRSFDEAAASAQSINGTQTSGQIGANDSLPSANVSDLFIDWVSATAGAGDNQDEFTFGYIEPGSVVTEGTSAFEAGSTIGSDIGIYTDVRTTAEQLGSVSNLALVTPVPEPATWATMACGAAFLLIIQRCRPRSV